MYSKQIEFITPEMAKDYLMFNSCNRKYRPYWAAQIASRIKQGVWQTTHQGIAFSDKGRLLDGQHRLSAIIMSGIPIKIEVTRGLDEETFKVIDDGARRSSADLSGLSKAQAEVCRAAAIFTFGSRHFSGDDIRAVYECGFGEVFDWLQEGITSKRRVFGSATVRCAAVVMIMNGHNRYYIKEILNNLILQNYDKLPKIALQFSKQVNTTSININDKYDLFARAIKVFNIENASLARLSLNENESIDAIALCRKTLKDNLKGKIQ